ncbi:hypothetical protein GALL_484690 [mine drainage metagenome]|uniref:Uncharacterized protein n=1 Tax=mine drainage metagenome TaxID=410659 RepID=A0A1J5PX82_9ZZZZ
MADRRQQRRAQPLGFRGKPGFLKVFVQADTFQRQRDLIDKRFKQAPVHRRKAAGVLVADADHTKAAFGGADRQKEPLRRG